MALDENTYYLFSLIIQSFVAVGAVTFGVMQTKINHRIKELQDYVAVTIQYKQIKDNHGSIKMMNIGRINLYLFKWEFGKEMSQFDEGILLGVNNDNAHVGIDIPDVTKITLDKVYSLKLYLKDSGGKKYISTHTVLRRGDSIFTTTTAPKKEKWNY